jgi:hypothetical protein
MCVGLLRNEMKEIQEFQLLEKSKIFTKGGNCAGAKKLFLYCCKCTEFQMNVLLFSMLNDCI